MANLPTSFRVEVKAGKPNLAKLLQHTRYHPKGRVEIDPATGEIVGAKNNILGYQEKIIRHESGVEIGKKRVPINGGHVKADGSVWRIGLGGPKKYHEKILADLEKFELSGKMDRSAPDLEIEEAREYHLYRIFLEEKDLRIADDKEFYKWKEKNNAEVKVVNRKGVDELDVKLDPPKKRGRPSKKEEESEE